MSFIYFSTQPCRNCGMGYEDCACYREKAPFCTGFDDKIIERIDLKRKVLSFVDKLSKRERFILVGRLQGDTLEALGYELGITGDRVRQIEFRAVCKIKQILDKDKNP